MRRPARAAHVIWLALVPLLMVGTLAQGPAGGDAEPLFEAALATNEPDGVALAGASALAERQGTPRIAELVKRAASARPAASLPPAIAVSASEDGDVVVVQAGREYVELSRNSMGEVIMATPAISDGVIVVRTLGHIWGIGPSRPIE